MDKKRNMAALYMVIVVMLDITGWQVVSGIELDYIGCFNHSEEWKTQPSTPNISVDTCKHHCSTNYIYVGVSKTDCYCDTEIRGEKVKDLYCDIQCNDTMSNSTCEESYTISVYKISDSRWLGTKIMCLTLSFSGLLLISCLTCVILGRRYYRNRSRSLEFTKALSRSFYLKNESATIEENVQLENDIEEAVIDDGYLVPVTTPPSDNNEDTYDRLKETYYVLPNETDTGYSYVDESQLSGPSRPQDEDYLHCKSGSNKREYDIQPITHEETERAHPRRQRDGRKRNRRRKVSNRISTFYDRIKINVLNQGRKRVDVKYYSDGTQYDLANHEHVQIRRPYNVDTSQSNLGESIEVQIRSQRTNTYDEVEIID